MKIVISIENENPFCAGWLACHLGLKSDAVALEGMAQQMWADGFKMRQETADMDVPDAHGHGSCHIAFLMESERPVGFVRHRVTAAVQP